MSSPHANHASSRYASIIRPTLKKIIKNTPWRKHSQLVVASKSVIKKVDSLSQTSDPSSPTPLYGFSPAEADIVLNPLVKLVDPALDCAFKLFSFGLIRGEIACPMEGNDRPVFISQLDSICKCGGLSNKAIELAVLKVLLFAVRSPFVLLRGDCLVNIVKSCYNAYLGGRSGSNQICAKYVLAQMMVIVFSRFEGFYCPIYLPLTIFC